MSLKDTEGNIVIKNSIHEGAYFGMKDRPYYPHFAYNKTETELDRAIQTSSWACLWMKNRFPSQVFNQAGLGLFGGNKGPLTIINNQIRKVQRGMSIESSWQLERQPLIISGNTIEQAIRSGLAISWGWDALVEDNNFKNNNMFFRLQEIDQALWSGTQPGRKVVFQRNRIQEDYDAGYLFFFHYNQANGGEDTGVNEDIDFQILNNSFAGGGGTHWGELPTKTFVTVGTNIVYSKLVGTRLEKNKIQWNNVDQNYIDSFADRGWVVEGNEFKDVA